MILSQKRRKIVKPIKTRGEKKTKLKVYLDTSVISALFDKQNPERRSLTESFFSGMKDFDPYISEITVAEIEKTPDYELRSKLAAR